MSPLANPKLAILMPTYRFDAAAKQALTAAAGIGSDDILVHIADNSENPEKHAFLADLVERNTNVVTTRHAKNIGALANWLFLLKTHHAPFICLAADDDSFTGAYFRAGLDVMMADAGCSAASGLHVAVAPEEQRDVPSLYSPSQRLEADPLERIRRYENQNSMAYAVVRYEDIQTFLGYVEANPIKLCFGDYLLAFHLLSIGTYRLDRSGFAYVYNDENWHLPDRAFNSYAGYYQMSGLPGEFAHFGKLHWAVANLHFFTSTFRSSQLSPSQASEIAIDLFERYKTTFRGEIRERKVAIDALLQNHRDAANALTSIMRSDGSDEIDIFDRFARIVEAFNGDVATRLRDFHLATHIPNDARPPRASARRKLRFWTRK